MAPKNTLNFHAGVLLGELFLAKHQREWTCMGERDMIIETGKDVKRDLETCQKRPEKQMQMHFCGTPARVALHERYVIRDLETCQKRPRNMSKETEETFSFLRKTSASGPAV